MSMLPSGHIALVCNPLAGSGRARRITVRLQDWLRERGLSHQVFTQAWPGEFSGFRAVWIIGGDGTMNYFINHYPRIGLPLALFPGGTGNDLHGMLYGGMSQEQQFLRVISCAPRPVDAGRCNDRLFINGAGIGFEGAVAHSLAGRRKLPGKTSFLLAVLRRILFYRSRYYQIRTPEESWEGRLLMISVGNGQRAGGGFRVTPAAQIDDGLLDMICVDPLMPLSRIRYLPVIEKGRHLGLPFVHALRTTELWIRSDGPIPVHLDGELYSSRELHLEILPGRFQFLY